MRLVQKQVLAPRMIQSMEILQLPIMALNDRIEQELIEEGLPVEEVQKIAILDIRIMNADRNSANLLCRRRTDNSLELVPIDHGFCLRSMADVSWMDWCLRDWPQLKKVRKSGVVC